MLKEEGQKLAESELKGKKEGRSSHQAQRKTMELVGVPYFYH